MMGYDIREVLPEVFRIPVPLEGNPLKELNSYLFRAAGRRSSAICWWIPDFGQKAAKKRSLRDWGSLAYPWRIRISC